MKPVYGWALMIALFIPALITPCCGIIFGAIVHRIFDNSHSKRFAAICVLLNILISLVEIAGGICLGIFWDEAKEFFTSLHSKIFES